MFAQGTLSPALNYQPGNPAYERVWERHHRGRRGVQRSRQLHHLHRLRMDLAGRGQQPAPQRDLPRRRRSRPARSCPTPPRRPLGSPNPRDLWAWLQNYEDKTGGEVLAIPHNGNLSNGMMFALQDDFAGGAPLDADYAETRAEVGAAVRGDPDQGRWRGASLPVARGRVRRFRELGLGQPRRLGRPRRPRCCRANTPAPACSAA